MKVVLFPAPALALLAIAAPLHAQSNSFTGLLATSTGYSDNVNLAPAEMTELTPGQETAIADGFTTIAPTLVYVRDNRTSVHQVSYTFNAQLYFDQSEANSYTNTLGWQAEYLLSRISRMRLSATALQGQTNNFAVASPGVQVEAQRAGGTQFLFLIGGQGYSRDFSRFWRFDEQTNFRTFIPLEGGSADQFDVENILTWERVYQRSAIVPQYRNQYFFALGEGQQHQFLTGPQLSYRRDFLQSWNYELTAGLIGVTSPTNFDATGITIEPVGQAELRFRRLRSEATLNISHDAQSNIQVGEFFISDSVNLGGNYTLLRDPQVIIRGLVGASRARDISVIDNSIGSSSTIFLADAGIAWQVRPSLELGARYVFQKQNADPNSSLLSFTSNTGLITLTGVYPAGPIRQANLRRSVRVDGTDTNDPFGGSDRQTGAQDKPGAASERRR